MTTLSEIFIHELKDIFSAESQLIKALPKMAKASATPELAEAFTTHLEQTKVQRDRLQQIGEILEEKLTGETCKAMQGLIEEGEGIVEDFDESAARDAALVAAAQRVEHYEISAYGSALALAKALGHEDVVALLEQTLQEEADTDKLLTQICESTVVPAALEDEDEEDEDDEDEDEDGSSVKTSAKSKKSTASQKTKSTAKAKSKKSK